PAVVAAVGDGKRREVLVGWAEVNRQERGADSSVGGVADIELEVDLAIEVVLFQLRQQVRAPAPARTLIGIRPGCRVVVADGKGAAAVVVAVHRQANLPQVVLTGGQVGQLADLLHRRQGQGD